MGFIKLMKDSDETAELNKYPNCLSLLTLIARRAKRTNSFSASGLKMNQALIGDYKSCGLTERKYRTAKENLKKWGFVTFKATNKGTVATLLNTSVFDINTETTDEQVDSQPTNNRRTTDEQPTTNKNVKKSLSFYDRASLKELFLFLNKKIHSKKLCIETPDFISKLRARLKHFTKQEITNQRLIHFKTTG